MTDNETLGDALGPGVTTDDLAETERVLKRFEAVADDEFEDCPQWLTTAHRTVCRALEHYDSELGETTDTEEELRALVADLKERGSKKEKHGESYATVGHGTGLLTAADELEWALDDE